MVYFFKMSHFIKTILILSKIIIETSFSSSSMFYKIYLFKTREIIIKYPSWI